MSERPDRFSADDIASSEEFTWQHPKNPKSRLRGVSLSQHCGLERIGLHRIRLEPGAEANEYHAHHFEEEFYFVLEGRGVMLVDGEEVEVGPGGFFGFRAPSVPHLMTNPFEDDLVYLVGGERKAFEIADFPRLGQTMIRDRGQAWIVDNESLQPFWKSRSKD
ncbi:MAG: cupin domain-containing protein [Planctomycetota bacterium]